MHRHAERGLEMVSTKGQSSAATRDALNKKDRNGTVTSTEASPSSSCSSCDKNRIKSGIPSPAAKHSWSRSFPENSFSFDDWDLPDASVQLQQDENDKMEEKRQSLQDQRCALEKNVVELQRQLKNEQAMRHALETAMSRSSSKAVSPVHECLTPQTRELLNEISFLEEEVGGLEQELLSLYRHVFTRCLSRPSVPAHKSMESCRQSCAFDEVQEKQAATEQNKLSKFNTDEKQRESRILCNVNGTRSPKASSLSAHLKFGHERRTNQATRISRSSSHSIKAFSSKLSLDNDGPRPLKEYLSETPSKLSEELVRCMAMIYCKLSDPPATHCRVPESPYSSTTSSSTSLSSVQGMLSDGWSPGYKAEYPDDVPSIDPFQVKDKRGVSGAYRFMLDVPRICVEKERLGHVARMLRDFRSMVEQLENVDPSRLSHAEKLAFWINVYNALLMHAYLAYGIPRSNVKRMTLLQRAAYKIGGHSINAYTIEHFILKYQPHRSAQWLQNLFSPGTKLKANDARRSYAIEIAEPLVCFALCCGGRSDPAIRLYTAKNVYKELDAAKTEFLQASIGFQNDKKILLPKIAEWYIREASISSSSLFDWISEHLHDTEKEALHRCIQLRPNKNASHCIEWQPYNFSFRYLFHPELATSFSSRIQQ